MNRAHTYGEIVGRPEPDQGLSLSLFFRNRSKYRETVEGCGVTHWKAVVKRQKLSLEIDFIIPPRASRRVRDLLVTRPCFLFIRHTWQTRRPAT